MSANPQFINSIKNAAAQIANGGGTAFATLISGSSSGTRIDACSVTNGDASNAYVLQVALRVGSTDYVLGEVAVPAGSGTNGTAPAVNVLDVNALPALTASAGVLFLASGSAFRIRSKTAVSGVNTLNIVAVGGDY